MLTRRLIRIKVFQCLYGATVGNTIDQSYSGLVGKLHQSVQGFYETFQAVLLLPLSCKQFLQNYLNPSEEKYIIDDLSVKTYESFTQNPILLDLENQTIAREFFNSPSIQWLSYETLLRDIYKEYIKGKIGNSIDILNPQWPFFYQMICDFFDFILNGNASFDQIMESERIQWYDEKVSVKKMIQNAIKTYKSPKPKFNLKSNKDNILREQDFGDLLLEKALLDYASIQDLIDQQTSKWELERIAKVDKILMTLALVEMIYFPDIPLKVSINEYIEIAKDYSTKDSGKFVNGILDKVKNYLIQEGKLNKTGRGLQ